MISDIITKLDLMGSNETSLLLAMTITMLRKNVKLKCNKYAQLCGVTLITGIRKR